MLAERACVLDAIDATALHGVGMDNVALDQIDLRLLESVEKNCLQLQADLGERVHLSAAAAKRRRE